KAPRTKHQGRRTRSTHYSLRSAVIGSNAVARRESRRARRRPPAPPRIRSSADRSEAKGSFYWGGAFGTWFWLDPGNDVVVVGMTRKLVYQSLADPKK